MKQTKPRKPSNHQIIIGKLVTVDFSSKNNKSFWPNEMRIASQLIKKYGLELLLWIKPPNNYKVSSLVWFLTKEGKHYLSDQLFEYSKANTNLTSQEQIVVSNEKVGEDVIIEARPKTLKEFLDYYGKERRQGTTDRLESTQQESNGSAVGEE
jgi:hypothetical protein